MWGEARERKTWTVSPDQVELSSEEEDELNWAIKPSRKYSTKSCIRWWQNVAINLYSVVKLFWLYLWHQGLVVLLVDVSVLFGKLFFWCLSFYCALASPAVTLCFKYKYGQSFGLKGVVLSTSSWQKKLWKLKPLMALPKRTLVYLNL